MYLIYFGTHLVDCPFVDHRSFQMDLANLSPGSSAGCEVSGALPKDTRWIEDADGWGVGDCGSPGVLDGCRKWLQLHSSIILIVFTSKVVLCQDVFMLYRSVKVFIFCIFLDKTTNYACLFSKCPRKTLVWKKQPGCEIIAIGDRV